MENPQIMAVTREIPSLSHFLKNLWFRYPHFAVMFHKVVFFFLVLISSFSVLHVKWIDSFYSLPYCNKAKWCFVTWIVFIISKYRIYQILHVWQEGGKLWVSNIWPDLFVAIRESRYQSLLRSGWNIIFYFLLSFFLSHQLLVSKFLHAMWT